MDRRSAAFLERRAEVWARAVALFGGYARCWYCGITLDPEAWSIDHQVPTSRGGLTEAANLVAACFPCNISKKDRTVDEHRARLIFRWRRDLLAAREALNVAAGWLDTFPVNPAVATGLEEIADAMMVAVLRFAGERES